MPIRVHPLPALPQMEEAGIDGAPPPDPMEEQLKIVEAEKAKAKEYADQLKLQKEKEASHYEKDSEYSFLKICKMWSVNDIIPSNPKINNLLSGKGSVLRKPSAPSHIFPWPSALERTISLSNK